MNLIVEEAETQDVVVFRTVAWECGGSMIGASYTGSFR
jgi:hypothetical protein